MRPFAAATRRPGVPSLSVRMPNIFPALRSYMFSILVLTVAAALGGCSTVGQDNGLKWPWGAAKDELTADAASEDSAQPADREPAQEEPAEQVVGADSDGDAGWNLHTLESIQPPDDTLSLARAWMLATQNDPEYQAALSGRAAAETEIRLGRAAILPQVQAGYSRSRIEGLQRQYAGDRMREGQLDYDSTSAYIQLQQPVFNIDRYAQFQRGYARAQLGEAEFAVAEYEAAMRLTTAYMDAVAAQGSLQLNRVLAESLEEQAATQDALFERNEGDRVDAQETRSRLALAQADVIAAEDELRVALRQMESLIGQEPPALIDVSGIEPHTAELGEPLGDWLERAMNNGAVIRAASARVRVADTEVTRAAGRHLPTADLVVGLSDADSENLDSLSQKSNTFTVGVRVAIPIFSGGYDTANHARSRFERQQATQELDQAREQVAAEVTRQYNAVQSGAQRIAALMASVRAGEESLEAARYGYEYGVSSNLDVLRSQDNLFRARQELLAARVAWLEARIALAAAAGEPVASAFMEADRALSL